jgi:hypothetical protein
MAALLALPAAAAPPARDAARLGLLLERVGSLRLQVLEGIGAERARRALAASLREADEALATAARDAPAGLREHYALMAALWRQHRAWLGKAGTRESIVAQRDRDEELAWLAERGRSLAGEPPGPADEAWHAARLSQQVMRLALLRRAGLGTGEAAEGDDRLQQLRDRMDHLQQAVAGAPAAQAEVDVARSQLQFLERALRERPLGARSADVAARSADHVLEALQRALRRLEGVSGARD